MMSACEHGLVEASPIPGRGRAWAGYAFALALCIAALGFIPRLWEIDLTLPLTYGWDSAFYQMLAKGTVENGWYLHNPRLGAPHGFDARDFPLADSLHVGLVWLIGRVAADPVLTCNLFFLATFPLTTLTSLFVLRRFGCAWGPAILSSLLYTFLPYHLLRACQLFFAAYFHVPLMVLVILWLYRDDFFGHGASRFQWRSGKFLTSLLICVLVACGGVYYAFFGCGFLAVAGVAAATTRRSAARLWPCALLIAAVVLGGAANGIPYLQARAELGPNTGALRRSPAGAELYGLKVAQLLLPVTNHRIPALASLKARYNEKMPLVTDNDFSALGVLGGIGFLLLIARLFVRRQSAEPSTFEALSMLNLFAVLLAAIGGFGFFVCAVLPEIRAFNRISVYIGFFALFALALALSQIQHRFAASASGRARRHLLHGLLALLLVGGVLDQTPDPLPFHAHTAAYQEDAAFVHAIEEVLPEGAMVFQLPYTPYPENPPPHRMMDYDHARGYLHSRTLKWSYPTMRGRWGDNWQSAVSRKAPDELVATLALAGFSGLYIDRFGYADGAAELEKDLARVLRRPPIVSRQGRLAFYNLTDYAARLKQRYPDQDWPALRERVLTLQPVNFVPAEATGP
jgi:hypothetical protein